MMMSPRAHRTLVWSERALIAAGLACLGWVYVQQHEASSYQRIARDAVARFEPARALPGEGDPSDPDALPHDDPLIGLLEIPKVGLSAAVLEGDDDRALRIAVGHLPDTPLPWDEGNAAFAGHRDTFFRPLKDLQVGDGIRLATRRGEFEYAVRRILIVDPDDLWVLHPDDSNVKLTLVTCYPFHFVGSAPQRFIVHAERRAASRVRPVGDVPLAFGFRRR
jgi:sortase A